MALAAIDRFSEFIARQRILLKRERDADIERTSLVLSNCGPALLEQKGLSLAGLGLVGVTVGLGGKSLAELERPVAYHADPSFPPHNFRPGDLVRIEAHVSHHTSRKGKKSLKETAASTPAPEGVVFRITDTRIIIAIDAHDATEEVVVPEQCRVVKLANTVTHDRMEMALNRLERLVLTPGVGYTSPEFLNLVHVLLGLKTPSESRPVVHLDFFDEMLNSSQKEAVKFCMECPEVACIHGPPGTGKTRTLVELIRQLTSSTPANPKALRLLVCGASNLSVDNILERLLALKNEKGESLKVTRIGHPARIMAQQNILDSTLEVKATLTDQASLAKDVKNELETTLGILSGKGKGVKGKAPRGIERKKLWDDVRCLRKEYRQRESGTIKSVISESQVVIATCHSAGGRQLLNQEFDVVIIDEATQALEAVCWIPIFKAKKIVLAGDPMQLPPTILSSDFGDKGTKCKGKVDSLAKVNIDVDRISESDPGSPSSDKEEYGEENPIMMKTGKANTSLLQPPQSLETTLFDRLQNMYGQKVKRMLDIQYRMNSQICAFPSETLYSSNLHPHSSVANHLLSDLPNVETDAENDGILSTPVVLLDTAGCEYYERTDSSDPDEGSKLNENEASLVLMWFTKLVEVGITPDQIAVLTPYQAQVIFLSSLLRPLYDTALEIGSIDGMQGREKEAVIISLVRSNAKRDVGFLKEKRRLNVAMTRAKRHLCIVGDSSTVSHGSNYLKKWFAWLEGNADVRYAELGNLF